MIRASGIFFVSSAGTALFLKRSGEGDHSGEWCFPGGKVEDGETIEECAVRECLEEIGWCPDGKRILWTRTVSPVGPVLAPNANVAAGPASSEAVDFTTFLQKIDSEFVPTLDKEHVGYAWAPVAQPPEPLHPGCRIALDRLDMDELGVARAIMDGHLTSPQRYENVSLFAMRISGTGTAYRRSLDEYVYRRPENYLSDEFLARCNGLPVILEHPAKATLDSKEFSDRVVGTILLPYIVGDEVWGIAKIYDDAAIKMMKENVLSTSPSVVFRDPSVNSKVELENGSTLLIEGKPSLLDHLAICEHGVWDKGEDPNGITSRGDSTMTEEEMKAKKDAEEKLEKEKADAAAKADADAGEKLDQVLSCLDSLGKRMDAFETEEKKDSDEDEDDEDEEVVADKKRKDATKRKDEPSEREEMAERIKEQEKKKDSTKRKDEPAEREEMAERIKENEKKKADALYAKIDENIKNQIADLQKVIPRQLSDEDHAKLADAQARADDVFQAFGKKAPRPLDGETLLGYRRRLGGMLKEHSPTWKEVDLVAMPDSALGIAEKQIYADAMGVGLNPSDLPAGELRAVTRTDPGTGQRMTTFHGTTTFISQLGRAPRRVVDIRDPARVR